MSEINESIHRIIGILDSIKTNHPERVEDVKCILRTLNGYIKQIQNENNELTKMVKTYEKGKKK